VTDAKRRSLVLYLSELGTTLIDDKREEEKVNVYEIKFQSIYRETNSKEILLSLLFFILMLTAYKIEEITYKHKYKIQQSTGNTVNGLPSPLFKSV
jgi:hypothetical protein